MENTYKKELRSSVPFSLLIVMFLNIGLMNRFRKHIDCFSNSSSSPSRQAMADVTSIMKGGIKCWKYKTLIF